MGKKINRTQLLKAIYKKVDFIEQLTRVNARAMLAIAQKISGKITLEDEMLKTLETTAQAAQMSFKFETDEAEEDEENIKPIYQEGAAVRIKKGAYKGEIGVIIDTPILNTMSCYEILCKGRTIHLWEEQFELDDELDNETDDPAPSKSNEEICIGDIVSVKNPENRGLLIETGCVIKFASAASGHLYKIREINYPYRVILSSYERLIKKENESIKTDFGFRKGDIVRVTDVNGNRDIISQGVVTEVGGRAGICNYAFLVKSNAVDHYAITCYHERIFPITPKIGDVVRILIPAGRGLVGKILEIDQTRQIIFVDFKNYPKTGYFTYDVRVVTPELLKEGDEISNNDIELDCSVIIKPSYAIPGIYSHLKDKIGYVESISPKSKRCTVTFENAGEMNPINISMKYLKRVNTITSQCWET